MKAAIFKGIESIEVEEFPDPEEGPDDVVVKVHACGICGSDLHTYLHGAFVQPGQVMGHEFVGEVVHVGGNVDGIALGDRVTASPIVPCMQCARCKEGRYNLCGAAWANGIAYGRPGAFAEFERGMIRQRVNAGLARAKANGTKLGRRRVKPSVEARILELRANGDGILKIGRKLGIGTSVVQRVFKQEPHPS